MRKVLFSIGIFAFLCVLSVGFYSSYKISDMKMKMTHLEEALDEKETRETQYAEKLITKDTRCTIEEYDRYSGNLKEETTMAADNLLGMDRTELENFLKKSQTMYYQYSLVAFSPEHVVIRQSRTEYETYYLVDENGVVQVYKGDRKTLYEPTQIQTKDLPEDLQEEIQNGKYVESQEELYSFLENYSS
ncbi:hypothetical protein B5F53_04350 [Blautia sp. An249]|nr:hypothetical protein B5F53_04350 [Blautia sp. An249]